MFYLNLVSYLSSKTLKGILTFYFQEVLMMHFTIMGFIPNRKKLIRIQKQELDSKPDPDQANELLKSSLNMLIQKKLQKSLIR